MKLIQINYLYRNALGTADSFITTLNNFKDNSFDTKSFEKYTFNFNQCAPLYRAVEFEVPTPRCLC